MVLKQSEIHGICHDGKYHHRSAFLCETDFIKNNFLPHAIKKYKLTVANSITSNSMFFSLII